MPKMTKAHKELHRIALDIAYKGEVDVMDSLLEDLIKHLSKKDAEEFVALWRSDSDEETDDE